MELKTYRKLKKEVIIDWLEAHSETLREFHEDILDEQTSAWDHVIDEDL
jgi:hypothetical protein